jgi:tetratricopeptide (TPR) repeat protein
VKPPWRSLFFLLFCSGPASLLSVQPQLQDSSARVSQLIAEADDLASKTFDDEKALEKYQAALSLDSLNYEVLWKLSRSYVSVGEHIPTTSDEQKEEQLQAYERAVQYADESILVNPNGSMGYAQRASAKIHVALFRNFWKSSGLMNDVREDCERAIELDTTNAFAYDVLGRAHLKLSQRMKLFRWPFGVAWGNTEDAIAYFEKAISIHLNFIAYRMDAARAYIEKEEYEKAREQLSAVSTLPTLSENDDQSRREAADLLEQIKRK